MTDPSTSLITDTVRMTEVWNDRSYLDQGVPYPPEMAAAPTSTPLNTSRRSRRSWFERRPGTNFEIKVQSPEKQRPSPKRRRQSEEPEVLTLTHFTAPPRISFGKVKPGQVKDRTLLLRNPHEYQQFVKVEKVPEKKHFSVDAKCIPVPAGETCSLTITWAPKDAGNFREMILMQVDKAYRLQAYVFGSVEAPPPKKKTRKGGLLSTKVNRPFSVIHTASLANIDKSYSPEKMTVGQPKGKNAVAKATKNNRKSKDGRHHSQHLGGNTQNHENTENMKSKVEDKKQEKGVPGENMALKNLLSRSRKDGKISKKRMRRSNTYSNVSGLGLPVPIINGETVEGHTSMENLASVLKEQIDNYNVSGFEIIDSQPLKSSVCNKQSLELLPSFLETDVRIEKKSEDNSDSFVEVDSLEKDSDKDMDRNCPVNRKPMLEHSFVEIESSITHHNSHKDNDKRDESIEKSPVLNKNQSAGLIADRDILNNDIINSPVSYEASRLRSGKIRKDSAVNQLHMKESFVKDSLNETPNVIEPPSFLSPNSFVENAMKYKERSPMKHRQSAEMECSTNVTHLKNQLNNSKNIVRPGSFACEILNSQKQSLQNRLLQEAENKKSPSPEPVLNEYISHSIVMQQLGSVKTNLLDQSFKNSAPCEVFQSTKSQMQKTDSDKSQANILDRRETFVKKRSSPKFSVTASDVDFRRGTFVVGAKKAKLLEHQQQSEASPHRTTFTVSKKSITKMVKQRARARSDETPRTQRMRTRSQTKHSLIDKTEKANLERNSKKMGISHDSEIKVTNSTENQIVLKSETVTKKMPTEILEKEHLSAKQLIAEDILDGKDSVDNEFKVEGVILQEQTDEVSRRCTLTVTKSRPSDALLNRIKNGSLSTNLFSNANSSSLDNVERQLDSFNEGEEDSLEVSQKSNKNSTFEVSANKSILMNKSVVNNNSFPTTPNQLPNSPNPDHSRRSTHVIEKPKVLDLSRVDRKQLFPQIVDYEDDSSEDKSSKMEVKDESCNSKNTEETAQRLKDGTESTSLNSRRRVSARRSVDKPEKSMISAEYGKSKKTKNSETNRGLDQDKCLHQFRSKIADTDSAKDGNEQTDQAYFVPFDNKRIESVDKTTRTGPHTFLKKRSNAIVQNEDQMQAKRAKNDSEKNLEGKQKPPNKTFTRQRIRTTGSANERLERQALKPKAPMKGMAQSKLILVKKTRTALPKHPHPFAAKNMYYDERWMEKQERGFVNWLNFILTPAEEYQSNNIKVKVDAGKLAIDVAKGNIKLAPTNEVLSFRAYAAHRKLNRLRKSACRLFQSEEIIKVVQKLEAEVESKRLRVRKDKMMHADLGVKQKILDMLLSYNPLWLRIGLETIYGEVLPLQSNSDVIGLSRFILTRLLNSPDIAEEYAHPTVPHLYREGYAEVVAQHTLKKFMMLVYFLDKAKQGRLIEHNPCLFCKDSEYKASKDLLHQFSRDYLSGEGDITRHLGYLGYKVAYNQTALDEFDFAVSKLAVDLRDGLRLTRVMEFLSNKLDLSKTLRVPAISRLQKIHNVEVVFKTLEEKGIQTDKVTPRDVVDGHREKTLQLLWTIILHYQVELLLNEEQLKEEIAILQKSLKVKSQLKSLLSYDQKPRRESAEPDLHTQNPRLNLLLKWCRTVCAFYNIKIENFTVSFSDGRALCYILHHYHPGLLPAESIQIETTMTHMEDMEKKTQQNLGVSFNDSCNSSAAFGDVEDPEIFERLLNNEKENYKVLFEKVKELGGIPLMLKWSDMSNTIPDEKVVVTYLLYLCARLLDIRHESRAARIIQLAWRKYRLKRMEKELKVKNKAATIIQVAVRRFLSCRRLEQQEISAICIQRVWRGYQGRQVARKMREEKVLAKQKQAVLKLQCAIKQYLQRRKYLQMKQSVIQLQACCRGYLLRQKLSAAAVTIQKWVRGHLVRRQLELKGNSVKIIQAHIRSYLTRKYLHKLHRSATVIQTAYRAHRAKKSQHMKFCRLKESCITIQRTFRKYIEEKTWKEIKAAVKIQSFVRGCMARKRYRKTRNSVLKIQAACKSHLQRKQFMNAKKAVITLQGCIRAYLDGRKQKIQYQSMRQAAILIQASWRMVRQREIFKLARKSAVRIQACFRMYLESKQFKELKEVAIKCQRRYRAKVKAISARCQFLVKKGAAVAIQSCFRGHLVRKELKRVHNASLIIQSAYKSHLQRKSYIALRAAVVKIQRLQRAKRAGKYARENFHVMKCAALKIQKVSRGFRARQQYQEARMKIIRLQALIRGYQERQKYVKLKQAAVVIQRKWHAELIAREHVASYHRCRNSVIQIQSFIRMTKQRQRYITLRKAAVLGQSCVRMNIQRRKYTNKRKAVLVLQERFRARQVGQKCRRQYLVCLGAIMTIQSAYRGFCVRKEMGRKQHAAVKIQSHVRMLQQKQKFVQLKRAVKICQRQYRAKREGQKCRQRYLIGIGAVITIQSAYRGYLIRREIENKQRAAIKIQTHFRSYFQRKKFLKLKLAAITCQRLFRAKLAGRFQRHEFLVKKSSAIKIQSMYRQHNCRQKYLEDKYKIIQSQACVRRYQIRKKFLNTKVAVAVIQKRWREILVARQHRSDYQKLRKSAILIQATWRMKREQRNFDHIKNSVIRIQSLVRMLNKQKYFRALKSAAENIQKRYRAKLIADQCRHDFLISKGAAITIQALIRGHLVRKNMQRKTKAATVIQSHFRGHLERSNYCKLKRVTSVCQERYRAKLIKRKVQNQFETIKRGVVALQALFRSHVQRSRYLKLRNSVISVQSCFRGNQTRSYLKELKHAAMVIQRRHRANLMARQQRLKYLSLQRATIKIQSYLRMKQARSNYAKAVRAVTKLQSLARMGTVRKMYLMRKESAVKIQQWFRGVLESRRLVYELLVIRGAAITIQAAVRGFLARRRYHRVCAAVKIQGAYRCYRQRMKYQSIRSSIILAQSVVRRYLARKKVKEVRNRQKAAILIQQRWSATKQACKERHDYLTLKKAVSVCQSAYRAKYAMLIAQRNFVIHKKAAITIQSVVRGHLVRKILKSQSSAAVVIQSSFRCYWERKKFLRLRKAALVCEARLRANFLGQNQRNNFLSLKRAVIQLQALRRGAVCRREFLRQRNAAVRIQSCVRGYRIRKWLTRATEAAIVLQRRWRAELLCREEVIEYQKLRETAITIQSAFRGNRARCLFSQMRAAVKIQSYIRMVFAQKRFRKTLSATVKIQACSKMWRARKEYLAAKEERCKQRKAQLGRISMVAKVNIAAIRIQHCYRSYSITKLAKERLQSVILIQRWIRAKLERKKYLQTRERLCRLQAAIRGWLARRHSAARVIQRAARKWFGNKQTRQECRAAVKIQALWRGYSLRKKSKSKRLTLVRQRVEKANAAATEDRKLGNRTSSALDYLLNYHYLSPVLDALQHLDVATRLSPVCCERMVEVNALSVLYRLVNGCNRSLPAMEIIKYTVHILLNLAKYEKTRSAVYSEEDAVHTIVELIQRYREKKGTIFTKACTLLGILALDNAFKKSLLEDKKLVERLQSIHNLTSRKHKLEENQRITRARMNATFNTTFLVKSPVKRHKIKPDWSLHRDKLSDFDNPLKAINFVLGNLGIATK